MSAIDELGKLAEELEKSAGRVKAGHKYKRRRWKNGRWQYDYGHGWGVRPSKQGDEPKRAEPSKKPKGKGAQRTHDFYMKIAGPYGEGDVEAYDSAIDHIEKHGVKNVDPATLVIAHEGHVIYDENTDEKGHGKKMDAIEAVFRARTGKGVPDWYDFNKEPGWKRLHDGWGEASKKPKGTQRTQADPFVSQQARETAKFFLEEEGNFHSLPYSDLKDLVADLAASKPKGRYREYLNYAREELRQREIGDLGMFDEPQPVSTKKTRKSMDNIETPKSAVLSKGLHSFCDYDNKMRKLKKEWLADYVDAFIEEAYEHERMERAHRDPNLMPASNNPAQDIAQAVFNEFMAYCPHNKNLSAAHEHLKVSVDYVESRMRAKNLLHVDSENHEANNKAAVGGYHPTPLALSQDAYAEAEAERNANLQRLGLLKKSEDQVQLAAGDNPINRLAEYEAQRVAAYSAGYGGTAAPAKVDPACPFHGRDMMKSGIESRAVHGAVCSCD